MGGVDGGCFSWEDIVCLMLFQLLLLIVDDRRSNDTSSGVEKAFCLLGNKGKATGDSGSRSGDGASLGRNVGCF